jgi:Nuclease-related domain
MLMTTMLLVIALGIFEGAIVSTFFFKDNQVPVSVLAAAICGGLIICRLCQAQTRRIDRYERGRMKWRQGTIGEHSVAATLARLPDDYFIFNDVKARFGNLDHVVVGPTGLFAIETKNWRGVVTPDENGELVSIGVSQSKPQGRRFLGACMSTLEQIRTLTDRDDIFIRAVMVFPKARVEVPYGSTGRVHCLTDGQLCSYIENEKFSAKLRASEVRVLVRALEGVARIEPEFGEPESAPAGLSSVHRQPVAVS